MATRPKVHRAESSRSIAMIAQRRAETDDRTRDLLPDSPDSDPREVLDYLRHHTGAGIPHWVLQADVCDALTLNNWLWWEDRRRELYWLRAGTERGLYLTQLGALVGVGKQGVRDRIDRLDALLRYDRPDEKLTRQARSQRRETGEPETQEEEWLKTHRAELVDIGVALVEQADLYQLSDTDREWLDELAVDARDGNLTPATMIILGLAVGELRTARPVLALTSERPFKVHTLLARADALRTRFAELGAKGRTVDREPARSTRRGLPR
jgi:hypothetical protein